MTHKKHRQRNRVNKLSVFTLLIRTYTDKDLKGIMQVDRNPIETRTIKNIEVLFKILSHPIEDLKKKK